MASRKDSEEKTGKPSLPSPAVEKMRKALGESAEGVDDDVLLLLSGYAKAVIAQVFREIEGEIEQRGKQRGGEEMSEGA